MPKSSSTASKSSRANSHPPMPGIPCNPRFTLALRNCKSAPTKFASTNPAPAASTGPPREPISPATNASFKTTSSLSTSPAITSACRPSNRMEESSTTSILSRANSTSATSSPFESPSAPVAAADGDSNGEDVADVEFALERIEVVDDSSIRLLGRHAEVIAGDVERELVVLNEAFVAGEIGSRGGPVEAAGAGFVDANFVGADLQLRSAKVNRGLHGIPGIGGCELARDDLLAVDEDFGMEIGVEFVAGFHVFGQAEDDHGGLFGAVPEVATFAMIDEPERGFGKQRACGFYKAEQAHGKGRSFGIIVDLEFHQVIVGGGPAGFEIGDDCLRFDRSGEFLRLGLIVCGEQREGEHGEPLRVHVAARGPSVVQVLWLGSVVQSEGVDDVGAQVLAHVGMLSELRVQIIERAIERVGARIVTGFASLAKAANDVGSHEDLTFVFFPPAPAAVIVLEIFQARHAGFDFLFEFGSVHGGLQLQLLHSFGDDDVGEEAGHGLLGAAVRIGGEIVERGEDASGQRRAEGDVQSRGRLIGIPWKRDDGFFFLIGARDRAGFRVVLFHAKRNYGKRDLHGVGFFVSESFREQIGFVNRLRVDAPVNLGFAFCGNLDGSGLA